jgi:HEAT repeat protein
MSTLVSLDPNQYVIWHYMMMQAELGEVGFARRVDKYLTEYIPGLSTEAALSRARRGDRSFLPLAARGLKSSLPHERQIAVRGLGELRAAEYLSDFRAAAGDTNAPVRAAAAYSLGATGDTGAVATLLELSRDSDAWVRQPATLALGRVGGAPAESRLAELLADDQSCVRVAAVAALLHLERTGRH